MHWGWRPPCPPAHNEACEDYSFALRPGRTKTMRSNMKAIAAFALFMLSAGAADHKTAAISVLVVPEAMLSVQGADIVGVRIRLSQSAKAQVWIGDNCLVPLPNSRSIGQSGEYNIALSTLPGTGRMVCLLSATDGLAKSAPLPRARIADAVRCENSTCYVM